MPTLVLRLAGPLQSWGDSSRFNHRHTRQEPTKSGVLGLLAAAEGRRRSDSIEDLLRLRFGVRADQPGRLVRDFQTEVNGRSGHPRPLTYRYYLADAVFVAAVEGPEEVITTLREALRHPVFPLFLGRRSCPPVGPLWLGVREHRLEDTLRSEVWQAANWYRRRQGATVHLDVVRDAADGERGMGSMRDLPLSFAESNRDYAWRDITRETVTVANPGGRAPRHDALALLEGD